MAVRDHFRAYARRRVDLGATLRDRKTGEAQAVRVRDLSLGGAGIELAEGVEAIGAGQGATDALLLDVTAPTLWDPLPLRGTVAWVRRSAGKASNTRGSGSPSAPCAPYPIRAGIRFEHQDAALLYALYQLLGAHTFEL